MLYTCIVFHNECEGVLQFKESEFFYRLQNRAAGRENSHFLTPAQKCKENAIKQRIFATELSMYEKLVFCSL